MNPRISQALVVVLAGWTLCGGCGTTKWSDTKRTATEQLLLSDAMDRAVAGMDFRAVAGENVYLDSEPLRAVTDASYLVSLLRQHMLASGCCVMEKRDEADYVVEVRAGAVGTDRREVMFGIPATGALNALPGGAVAPAIPEMPLANKTEQRAVVKLAVFAYNRHTGRPIWQSGTVPVESTAKNLWVLGAGPFERGTIYEGTGFAGQPIEIPLVDDGEEGNEKHGDLAVTDEAYFAEPKELPTLKQLTAPQLATLGTDPAAKVDAKKPDTKEPAAKKPAPQVAKKAPPKEPADSPKSEVVPAAHNAEIPPEPDDESESD